MVTRYVHADNWETDECPNLPDPPLGYFYPPGTNTHICPTLTYGTDAPGDRFHYMQCQNCTAVIWGHFQIEEDPL